MYTEIGSIHQLIDRLSNESLEPDEYWLIFLADVHSQWVQTLIDRLNQLDIPFFGGIFPGLISGSMHHITGVVYQSVRCLAHPVIIPLNEFSLNSLENLPPLNNLKLDDATLLCFPDCNAPNISHFLIEIFNRYANEVNYFGANAGYGDLRKAPSLFSNDGFFKQGVLVALAQVQSKVSAKHGWQRITGPFVATKTSGNIIYEINWQPAESFYRSILQPELANVTRDEFFTKVSAHYPLCIEKKGTEDVMRDPLGVTEQGGIICLSEVEEGAAMYLMQGAANALKEAALDAVSQAATDSDFSGALVCDCFSRVLLLQERFQEELQAVCEKIQSANSQVTPEGVIALGEIASDGNHAIELYNKTFGICVYHG